MEIPTVYVRCYIEPVRVSFTGGGWSPATLTLSGFLSRKGEDMNGYMIRRPSEGGYDYICYRGGDVRVFGSKSAVIRYLHLRGMDMKINSRNIHELTTIQIQECERNA